MKQQDLFSLKNNEKNLVMSSAAVMIGALRVKPGCWEQHYEGICNNYYVLVWDWLTFAEISNEGLIKVNGCTPYFLSFSQNETSVLTSCLLP